MTTHAYRFACVCAAALAGACAPADDLGFEDVEEDADVPTGGKADSGAMAGPIVVTEVGDDFVEVRNDGDEPVELAGYYVSFSYRRVRLEPRPDRASVVAPGQLALIVDADAPVPARAPRWLPVVHTSRNLGELLAYSKSLIVRTPDKWVADRADARNPPAPGASVERRLKTRWVVSPIGATPGLRNATDEGSAVQMWFSAPDEDDDEALPAALAAWIDDAEATIDAAVYQLDHPAVIDALVRAADRGVAVRLATDTTYYERKDYADGYAALEAAGVAVVADGRTARQHNKFFARDGRAVWTGGYNPVVEDAGPVANDAVAIESQSLALAHTAEVDEMFAGRFGPAKADGAGHVDYVDGARIEVYFSPTDHAKARVIERIAAAEHSVLFAQFSFYDDDIGAAMLGRAAAGVEVRGVFDRRSATSQTQWQPMVDAGLDVRRPYFDAMLHHKVIIIDYGARDPIVITGSFNLTGKADTANDESLVVIHDPHVARAYYETWARLYARCSGPNTDTAGVAPLAITEVFVDVSGKASFVELANLDSAPAELAGLALRDREGHRVALSGVVASGGRAVVDAAALDLAWNDALLVEDGQGRIAAAFDHGVYPGVGRSLERQDVAAADLDAVWAPSDLAGGSPGW